MFKWLQNEEAEAGPSSGGSMLVSLFARKSVRISTVGDSRESEVEILRQALMDDGLPSG